MARLLGRAPEIREVAGRLAHELAQRFGLQPLAADDPAERLALPR
jgi:hypothetical protein